MWHEASASSWLCIYMVILAVSTVTAVSARRFLRLVLGCRNCITILSDLTLQTGPRQKSLGLNAEASVELLALYMIIIAVTTQLCQLEVVAEFTG